MECSNIWYTQLHRLVTDLIEKIKRIESHQSHVKGVTFDPALKYFATEVRPRLARLIIYRAMIALSRYGAQQTLHLRKRYLSRSITPLLPLIFVVPLGPLTV